MLHYVFGYGSLVNKDSREKTVSTNKVLSMLFNRKIYTLLDLSSKI